ncbi:MAG TPA: hypothetical protein P5528_02165 [Steroidobacteraceae bacterium]|nr:hypothetical protein [Steroidobacteraceae bacterium]
MAESQVMPDGSGPTATATDSALIALPAVSGTPVRRAISATAGLCATGLVSSTITGTQIAAVSG